jgi:hypothetical protein
VARDVVSLISSLHQGAIQAARSGKIGENGCATKTAASAARLKVSNEGHGVLLVMRLNVVVWTALIGLQQVGQKAPRL